MASTPTRTSGQAEQHSRIPRPILLGIGWTSVALGLIGVVVPGLPTTTFLIIAAWCFVRSSERAYAWLLEHRILGPYVRDYLSGKGMPVKSKVIALTMMWLACSTSAYFFVPNRFGQAAVMACAVIGTYLVLVRVPTRVSENPATPVRQTAEEHVL